MVQEVVTKPVNTAQPAIQQGDQHEGAMVKEVVIKLVVTAASQEIQVHLSMDNNNLLPSPKTLRDAQEASKLIEDEDTPSMEVFKLPRDTTYGMEDDVPDLVNKKVAIKPAPPHVQGPSNPGSPLPPEAETNRDADCQVQLIQQQLPQPPDKQQGERHVNGHVEGQPLAHIPLQTSMEADCQDQFAQQQLLQPPDKQQGERHANGHVYVSRQVQYKTVKLCKTLTFKKQSDKKLVPVTTFNFVKVALLTQLEELLIRNRAMCIILCLGHIYFVVFSKNAPLLGLKSIVFH